MIRRYGLPMLLAGAMLFAGSAALAQQPNFSAALWGDGQLWGTKAVTVLPAPNENSRNGQSFDKLYVIVNSNNTSPQLPVAEAAPGNPQYNGGRWFTHTVEWTAAGFAAFGEVPIVTSSDEIMTLESMGYLTITAGSPGPPLYFLCPLLPIK
jgi:hypothetical protein